MFRKGINILVEIRSKGVRGINNPGSIQKTYTHDFENNSEPRQELCIVQMISVLEHKSYTNTVVPMKRQYTTS